VINDSFGNILDDIAHLDSFRGNTSTIFVVYAHKSDVGEARAEIAKQLIDWLKKVRAQVQSDRSPLGASKLVGSSLNGDELPAHNILWNQFYLLPKSSYDHSVDKIILCCSEALLKHHETCLKTEGLKNYPKDIREAHSGSPKEPDAMHSVIENIIDKYKGKGKGEFHHVLTELAFLDIRKEISRKEDHGRTGVIPLILNKEPNLYESLPGYPVGTDLWVNAELESPTITHLNRHLHKLFFKLLKKLYPKNQPMIDNFDAYYGSCVQWLEERPEPVSKTQFSEYVRQERAKVFDKVANDRASDYRTLEKEG
jgi:hypothetical protein